MQKTLQNSHKSVNTYVTSLMGESEMKNTTVDEVLECLDSVIEFLTDHDSCCSALEIAIELREEIIDTVYNNK